MLMLSRRVGERFVLRLEGRIVATVVLDGIKARGHHQWDCAGGQAKFGFDGDVEVNRIEVDMSKYPEDYECVS